MDSSSAIPASNIQIAEISKATGFILNLWEFSDATDSYHTLNVPYDITSYTLSDPTMATAIGEFLLLGDDAAPR